jgi:hypothetical protein
LRIISLRLRRDKRGISNAIVAILSLPLIVIIVANVILWSYQMNQLDSERNREFTTLVKVGRVTNSSWFVTRNEYTVIAGDQLNGSYKDTQAIGDGLWETFQERDLGVPALDLNGTFQIDTKTYPIAYVHRVDIKLMFKANYSTEGLRLKALNWTSMTYSNEGFNSTIGEQMTTNWSYYDVKIAYGWKSYIRSDGTINIELQDERQDINQTAIQIDFLGTRVLVNGSSFTIENDGPSPTHIVSIWIINTAHIRYSADTHINSGVTTVLIRADIPLPPQDFIAKITTERGNISVFPSDKQT